jgi:hypothetical protein
MVPVTELTGDAAKAAALWDGPVGTLEDALEAPHDLVLDGLFGGGLSRPLEGVAAQLAQRGGRVISIDVPSGICGLRAKPLGPCFIAEGRSPSPRCARRMFSAGIGLLRQCSRRGHRAFRYRRG